VVDEPGQTGATPSGPDPASGATPGGQQPTGSGATPGAGSTEGAKPDTSLGDAGRDALEKERGARRDADRKLAEARQRIADLEDSGRTEDQRREARLQRAQLELEQSTKRIQELEAQAADRELRDLRREVATEAGLPASMAQRLEGNDLRTLKADAKKLAEELHTGTPVGDLGIGRGGAASGQRSRVDMNQLIRQAAGRG
jgi:chromosome segregation ATPase